MGLYRAIHAGLALPRDGCGRFSYYFRIRTKNSELERDGNREVRAKKGQMYPNQLEAIERAEIKIRQRQGRSSRFSRFCPG